MKQIKVAPCDNIECVEYKKLGCQRAINHKTLLSSGWRGSNDMITGKGDSIRACELKVFPNSK